MTTKNTKELSYQATQFKDFFSGSKENFGLLQNIKTSSEGEKVSGSYVTIKDTPLTIEKYKDHLNGKTSLGIIPIDEESMCKFGVIDIDVYNVDLTSYLVAIEKERLPLIPFLSKSGGIHLYLFLKEKTPASEVRELMKKFATTLFLDKLSRDYTGRSLEIFPKQIKRSKEKVGSFINLPYYNVKETKQVALRGNEKLSLTNALHYMEKKKISLKDAYICLENIPFIDAPPCLQSLYLLNPFNKGMSGRNNYLFSFGVYFKKKEGELFEQNILNMNESLNEPLPEQEIERTIISSLKKKDYEYKCSEFPLIDYCNKDKCKLREYGVGKEDGFFSVVTMEKLTQYKMKKPYYIVTISCSIGKEKKIAEIRFDSALELDNQDHFRAACVDLLHVRPTKLKKIEWIKKVDNLLEHLEIEDVDPEDDVSRDNMIMYYIKEFILGRHFGEKKAHIKSLGKTYYNESKEEYWFDLTTLYKYLEKQLPIKQSLTNGELTQILKDMNAKVKVHKDEQSRSIRVWVITVKSLGDTSKHVLEDFDLGFTDEIF